MKLGRKTSEIQLGDTFGNLDIRELVYYSIRHSAVTYVHGNVVATLRYNLWDKIGDTVGTNTIINIEL